MTQFGPYALGKLLGSGSYSTVEEGHDIDTQERVALKIMFYGRLNKIPNGLYNVQRELAIHATIEHSYIVKCHKQFKTQEGICLVLECCESSLQDLISTGTVLSTSRVKRYLWQLLQALDHCHCKRILHQDIKPSNLLLTDGAQTLKLSDFGVAIDLDSEHARNFKIYSDMPTVGSLSFQAPELISDKYQDTRIEEEQLFKIDIWAAGIVFYYMLTGLLPFEAQSIIELFSKIESGKYVLPTSVPEGARQILFAMLAADPASRPSAGQLLAHEWFTDTEHVSQSTFYSDE